MLNGSILLRYLVLVLPLLKYLSVLLLEPLPFNERNFCLYLQKLLAVKFPGDNQMLDTLFDEYEGLAPCCHEDFYSPYGFPPDFQVNN